MNPKYKLWLDIGVLVALVVVAFGLFGGGQRFGTGGVQYDEWFFRGPVDLSSAYGLSASGAKGSKVFDGTNWIGPVNSTLGTFTTGVAIGGTSASNEIAALYETTSTVNSVTLGAIQTTTSTVTSTVALPFAGLAVGDGCLANLNVTTTNPFGVDCSVTSATSTNATATVTVWNGSSASYTLPTSTERLEVHHYAN